MAIIIMDVEVVVVIGSSSCVVGVDELAVTLFLFDVIIVDGASS